jgi:arylsulfatase A
MNTSYTAHQEGDQNTMNRRDPSTLDRRGFLTAACAALGAAGLARLGFGDEPSSSPAGAAETRRPNFVIIFTDDQGYQDLGCYGSPNIATPRIDRLAAEGMRFTDFHSASPVCTPSRAALLTGCYPARLSLEKGVLFPKSHRGLNPDEVTLAKLLKPLGYATTCIGKWHLGDAPEFLPLKHGFDSYFGIPYSNDMRPCCLMRDNEVIEEAVALDTLTERYTAAAVKFIGDHKDQPFFLYLPHTMPHTPLAASPKFAGKSKRGLYGDVVETIDWSTGEILDAIKAPAMVASVG